MVDPEEVFLVGELFEKVGELAGVGREAVDELLIGSGCENGVGQDAVDGGGDHPDDAVT